MAILKYLTIFSLGIILSGCYETFTPDIDTKPVLCLNSLITSGESVDVDVSHSWLFTDEYGERDHGVDDATISIYADGRLVTAGYAPGEGEEIRITGESPKYGKAEATVTVPKAVAMSCAQCTPTLISFYKDESQPMTYNVIFNIHFELAIEDNPQTSDYFKLDYSCYSPDGNDVPEHGYMSRASHAPYTFLYPGMPDTDAEPIFKEHIGVFESILGDDEGSLMIFTDRQFSGKQYTLNLTFRNVHYNVSAPEYDANLFDCRFVFYLATVSPSYYNRALYAWNRDIGSIGEIGDIGFAEPMWGYSNVSSGAGVVAACSITEVSINLRDFLESTFDSTPRP